MVHLKSCWTPCFWHGNVADGSTAAAVYTFSMSVCVVMYAVNIVTGGDSSQLYLPFFETSLASPSGGAGAAGSAQVGYNKQCAIFSETV